MLDSGLLLAGVSLPLVPSLLIGSSQLLVGLALGWWLWSSRSKPILPAAAPALPVEKARGLLEGVSGVVWGISEGVREHSAGLELVDQELQALCLREQPPSAEVAGAIAQLMQGNRELRDRLALAEAALGEQEEMVRSCMAEARSDALTGLPNRRAFEDELGRRFAEWQDSGRPLAVMLVDIDHFKGFNDKHGHLVGDAVLRGVGQILAESMREMDLLARYGGEEFFTLLPNTDVKCAMLVAEQARKRMRSCTFRAEEMDLHVTVSIGVAQALDGEDTQALLARADQALYAAKHDGRNTSHYHDGKQTRPVVVSCAEPGHSIHPCQVALSKGRTHGQLHQGTLRTSHTMPTAGSFPRSAEVVG